MATAPERRAPGPREGRRETSPETCNYEGRRVYVIWDNLNLHYDERDARWCATQYLDATLGFQVVRLGMISISWGTRHIHQATRRNDASLCATDASRELSSFADRPPARALAPHVREGRSPCARKSARDLASESLL